MSVTVGEIADGLLALKVCEVEQQEPAVRLRYPRNLTERLCDGLEIPKVMQAEGA
jgi:hypothetical protein